MCIALCRNMFDMLTKPFLSPSCFFLLVVKISDFCTIDRKHRTLPTHYDIAQHTIALHNSLGHYATYLSVAQHSKSKFLFYKSAHQNLQCTRWLINSKGGAANFCKSKNQGCHHQGKSGKILTFWKVSENQGISIFFVHVIPSDLCREIMESQGKVC